jgi:hypothetical protein
MGANKYETAAPQMQGEDEHRVARPVTTTRNWTAIMHDARYFRSQAELCLRIAEQLSDRNEVARLRAAAADHYARAQELEQRMSSQPLQSSKEDDSRAEN